MPTPNTPNDVVAILRRHFRSLQRAAGDEYLQVTLWGERQATIGDRQMSPVSRRRMLRALDDLEAELLPHHQRSS